MAVEVRPLGVKCNIQCQYCYQNPQRDAANVLHDYDIEKIKAAVNRTGGPFILFGGEPLLVPEPDLEALWSWGLETYGKNGVQTNGTLINDNHIRLFKKYKVDVGISLDGPGELNDVRWLGSLERTREATGKTLAAIERLCREGIPPSLIVTLHQCNATADKLPLLHDWFRHLDRIGVKSARLHVLETEAPNVRAKYGLSDDENVSALLSFLTLEERELKTIKFDVFKDMRNLLLGRDKDTTCVWNGCDPYTTRAVRGIEGQGQSSNCGRTNKDGIDFVKANNDGYERYLALYQTPQEHGGCQGCRFFLMCKGECPGTAIDGDWRNRTEDCEVWKRLFARLEAEMLDGGAEPVSTRPDRGLLEEFFLESWRRGRNTTIENALRSVTVEAGTNAVVAPDGGTAPGKRTVHLPGNGTAKPAHGIHHAADSSGFRVTLPEFVRTAWVSDLARQVWQPRLERIQKAWSEIQLLSVLNGVQKCAVTTLTPDRLVAKAGDLASHGLSLLPVATENIPRSPESGAAAAGGQVSGIRAIVGRPRDVFALHRAFGAHDDATIGHLLGCPVCCRKFLRQTRLEEGLLDTTWPMAVRSTDTDRSDGVFCVDMKGPAQTNALWRWLGIAATPHLSCRSDCKRSITLADSLMDIGRRSGCTEEMNWMMEIFSWPVEWTALHGIAEIKTPVIKIITRTDTTSQKHVVRWHGDQYPAEGARGLAFPYRKLPVPRLTGSSGFKHGLNRINTPLSTLGAR